MNFGDQLARLREGRDRFLSAGDFEGIHLLRTSARRLRAAVRFLPKPVRRSAEDKLRKLMAAVSPVRDADVLAVAVASCPVLQPDDAKSLQTAALKRRDAAAIRARAALEGPLFVEAIAAVEALPPVDAIPAGSVFKAVERAASQCPASWERAADEQLHDLRKSIKRLRYSLDAVKQSYGKPVARLIDRCTALQEALGAIQDVAAFGDLLRASRTFAAGQFLATVRARADAERQRLGGLWERAFGPRIAGRVGAHLLRRAVKPPAPPVEIRAAV